MNFHPQFPHLFSGLGEILYEICTYCFWTFLSLMKICTWMAALFYWHKWNYICTCTLETWHLERNDHLGKVYVLHHVAQHFQSLYYRACVCTHVHVNMVNLLNQNATSVKVNVNTEHTKWMINISYNNFSNIWINSFQFFTSCLYQYCEYWNQVYMINIIHMRTPTLSTTFKI
jgi:hypothetical protein